MKFDPDLGSLVDHHSVTELTDKIEESYCAVDIWSEVDDTLAVSILVDAMGLTSEQRHIIRSRALDTDATFAEIGAEIGINYKRVDNLIYKLRIQRGEELRQIIAA